MVMTLINIFLGLAFISFAYVNLNDDDSWLWVPIYLIPAFFCLATVFNLVFPTAYLIVIVLYLVYAMVLFFVKDGVRDWLTKYQMQNIAVSMQAEKPWIEKTREFFGLLIAAGALLMNYLVYG